MKKEKEVTLMGSSSFAARVEKRKKKKGETLPQEEQWMKEHFSKSPREGREGRVSFLPTVGAGKGEKSAAGQKGERNKFLREEEVREKKREKRNSCPILPKKKEKGKPRWTYIAHNSPSTFQVGKKRETPQEEKRQIAASDPFRRAVSALGRGGKRERGAFCRSRKKRGENELGE